ncbi:hypothetical protein [uncultured Sphingomonas sp.]|uniref:hypothetical protein n=1 Tax=uncultured Sphingomonas sp. TaxID=158754 RepID=UPI0025F3D46F|nr:hypothetical protein [uncultured Sphingomonas sp.]
MGVDEPTPDRGSQAISTKLDAAQLAQFELAVAASGLSRAAFIRAAVLRQGVVLRPYEPLMAQSLATLAACRTAVKNGKVACCRFGGHRDKVFSLNGEHQCSEGSSPASSSLRR